MPTSIPMNSRSIATTAADAHVVFWHEKILAVLRDPDFVSVSIIIVVGLLLAVLLTAYLPFPGDPAALLGGVS